MRSFKTCLGAIVAVFAGLNVAYGQTENIPPYEVVPDGREYTIRLSAKERNVKELSVYFVSIGNVSSAVEIRLSGPVGLKGSARSGFKGDADAQVALASSPLLQESKIRNEQRKELSSFNLSPSDDDPAFGSAYVWYHLQKDACTGNKSSQYITQVKLDLSGIDPALYEGIFPITIALKEFKYPGAKIASIKPSSHGKYRNEPILLMGSIAYGNEYVNIIGWKKNKIVSRRRIKVVKYVSYKGYGLSLARLLGTLNGGKHTFELSNGGDIYGVCFSAVRRRQVANGYPAPN